MMANLWQIACGDADRLYDRLFLDHDVMCCGPGRYGPFDAREYERVVKAGEFSQTKITQVRRFAEEVDPCDVILMRAGSQCRAIGMVAEVPYAHEDSFDDIHGWDLQHTRRVVWQHHLTNDVAGAEFFQPRGATFSQVHNSEVIETIEPLLDRFENRDLADMPERPSAVLSIPEVQDRLFDRGLSYDSVFRVGRTIEKLRRLVDWYGANDLSGVRPSEHEIVAHILVPLLESLGWSEQLLAVEWNKVDLALFAKTPTIEENCGVVIEAKTFGRGLGPVLAQARGYIEKHSLDSCQKLLLSDGQCFYLYGRDSDEPTGYLNLHSIRQRHLLFPDANAIDTLVALTPARVAA